MRRLIWITATAALLLGAGVAVAHEGEGKTVKAVSGTFTATTVSDLQTKTCTGSDGGSYAITRATYTGTATSSEPTLNGNATVDARSTINTTSGAGTVSGRLRIDSASGQHTTAGFDSVYSSGSVAGLAEGHASDHGGGLVANLSATFSAAGGFTNGKLGGGTSGGNAVVTTEGGCSPASVSKPDRIEVHGTVTAVSPSTGTPTSITVAGVTCSVPSTLASKVASVHVNDRVEMVCTVSGGTNTLTKLEPSHQKH